MIGTMLSDDVDASIIFFRYRHSSSMMAGCIWNLSLFDHLMHVIYRIVKSLAKQIHAISNSLSWSLSFDCMHFFAAAAIIYYIGRYTLMWFFKKRNYYTLQVYVGTWHISQIFLGTRHLPRCLLQDSVNYGSKLVQ